MGETDVNQFMQLRNQLVIPAENFGKKKRFSPLLIPTMSKDMVEQLKVAHKVVRIVDRANRQFCVTFTVHCCGTLWTSQKAFMLKSEFLQGRERTKSFKKLFRLNINLKISSVYLM